MEVAPEQGYYEHALLNRDEEIERGVIQTRASRIKRAFRLAAGVLAAILLAGFFVWIWLRTP